MHRILVTERTQGLVSSLRDLWNRWIDRALDNTSGLLANAAFRDQFETAGERGHAALSSVGVVSAVGAEIHVRCDRKRKDIRHVASGGLTEIVDRNAR